MITTEIGRHAEAQVASFLQSKNYKILAQNWRTRSCEIDLIAYKDKMIFFVEVKYRGSNRQGTGFEYITVAKRNRMAYAAQLWVAKHRWRGGYTLSAASVTRDGSIEYLEQI